MPVARVTSWMDDDGVNHVRAVDELWAIVETPFADDDQWYAVAMLDGSNYPLSYLREADGDVFEIVPEDRLPEWVCVALAKLALLGEDQ
jgi:hypothetical protein